MAGVRKFPIGITKKARCVLLWDEQKVLANIRQANTDDLLDRITVYRQGMEPDALDMIQDELRSRGVTPAQLATHREEREKSCLFLPDGMAVKCSLCRKPAVFKCWGWHKLLGTLPLFPRRFYYCQDHAP